MIPKMSIISLTSSMTDFLRDTVSPVVRKSNRDFRTSKE